MAKEKAEALIVLADTITVVNRVFTIRKGIDILREVLGIDPSV